MPSNLGGGGGCKFEYVLGLSCTNEYHYRKGVIVNANFQFNFPQQPQQQSADMDAVVEEYVTYMLATTV